MDVLFALVAVILLVAGFAVATANVSAAQIFFWTSAVMAVFGVIVHLITRAHSPRKEK